MNASDKLDSKKGSKIIYNSIWNKFDIYAYLDINKKEKFEALAPIY